MSLSTTIKSIQDIMRKDVGVDGDAQRISQIAWMLFLKILDDREQEAELLDDDFKSPIPKKLRWRTWAADPEGITGDTLLDFANNELFPGLKKLRVSRESNGFLACAIENIRKNEVKKPSQEKRLQASIHGVEKKPLPHLLCVTNMLLHGIDVPSNIRHDNTLARPLRDYGPKDRVDVVITNPPFGGKEEDGIESNFPKTFQTRETADLFLVLIMQLLKPGGRGALVLPDGTLFGEGVKTRIKEKLLNECNLHTIVRLPNGVFAPYTGIKTNLLFFTKGTPTRDIWYYEHPYPHGAKSYNKTKPINIAEFDAEKKWWGKPDARGGFKGRKESELAWKVSVKDVKENGYNLDIKNPHNADTGPGDPDELLAEYLKAKADTTQLLDSLKQELAEALVR